MRVASLYCGIGGIDLALQQAGHTVVWANDFDKYACMSYKHNFPEVPIDTASICNVDKYRIPDCDILTAGFPCQPFSTCGKQKGFRDTRGDAFFQICSVIDAKQPCIVFLENVANVAEHDNGKTFITIHNELSQRNYFIRYIIADACDYGVAQHRTRTYLLAFKDKTRCDKFSFPCKVPLKCHIIDVIHTDIRVDDRYYYIPGSAKFERLNKYIKDEKQLYRFADWGIQSSKDGISFTLKANMGTYYDRIPIIKDQFGIRRITPKECLALQGFPLEFELPDTVPESEQYKQIGNSVCCCVVGMMLHGIS